MSTIGTILNMVALHLQRGSSRNSRISPFELLFSRTVTGSLLLLKDAWINVSNTVIFKKKSFVEFVLGMRERLRSSIISLIYRPVDY